MHASAGFFSPVDLVRFLPEIILTVVGTFLMVLDPILHKRSSHAFGHLSLLALIAAMGGSIYAYTEPGKSFNDMLVVDGFATFFRVLVIGVGIFTVLLSYRFLEREDAETSEYHALLLFSVAGQCMMAASNDLIMIFIGLEISSISSYVLAGYLRDDKRSSESALKYFLLGSFATAFFLYGVALIYGSTGSVNLSEVRRIITGPDVPSPVFIGLAAALMFVGLGFKVSAAPFQMWAPDVYQGAPTPVAAFLSAGPKAAAFAIFLRIFTTAFEPMSIAWQPVVFGGAAVLSMTIGNFAALLQSNVKRMLAYSSIAHAGYLMVALTARDNGTPAAMFYLVAYAFMNIGAFAVVAHLSGKGERYQTLDDFAGLAQKQPLTAAMLTIFMLSLIGVPLTGGFFGKFYIFKAAIESKMVWLSVFGLLNSAVGAFYYLRVLVMMYMHEPSKASSEVEPLPWGLGTALVLPAIATLFLGIFPSWVLDFARSATLLK
ncbi:MAG TPA: NADH-quinone oxidoreductase subunit N [Bryobacteraceae bacterium]|nr:NADH-quinone oxidoreductase subunit N [Bryobacteraceae bacterium]